VHFDLGQPYYNNNNIIKDFLGEVKFREKYENKDAASATGCLLKIFGVASLKSNQKLLNNLRRNPL
jgi:hypothetical protein